MNEEIYKLQLVEVAVIQGDQILVAPIALLAKNHASAKLKAAFLADEASDDFDADKADILVRDFR